MKKKGRVENLKSNSERTPTERKELAIKAGKASGDARREKRDLKMKFAALMEAKRNGSKITIGDEVMDKVIDDLIENGDIYKLQKVFELLGLINKGDEKPSTTTIVINEVVARNGGQ